MIRLKNAALALGMLALFCAGAPATAQSASYGVVDMAKVLRTAEAAKGIFSDLESKRKEFQGQLAKQEEDLRASEQEILKQKDKMSREDFDKKRQEFQGKVTAAQKQVQDRKRMLDQAFSESLGKFRTEVLKVITDVAKEKGYTSVFSQEALILADPGTDITDAVIAGVNKSVKKIPINFSGKK